MKITKCPTRYAYGYGSLMGDKCASKLSGSRGNATNKSGSGGYHSGFDGVDKDAYEDSLIKMIDTNPRK